MAVLDSGFPCCLCVAMKEPLVPEAQLTAETLETGGSGWVHNQVPQHKETQLIILAVVWLLTVPHLGSSVGAAGTQVQPVGSLALRWCKDPMNPRGQSRAIPDPICWRLPRGESKSRRGCNIPADTWCHGKLSSAGSAIPGYVTHLWPQIHLIPFMHFCWQQNILAIAPGRMKEGSQSRSHTQWTWKGKVTNHPFPVVTLFSVSRAGFLSQILPQRPASG